MNDGNKEKYEDDWNSGTGAFLSGAWPLLSELVSRDISTAETRYEIDHNWIHLFSHDDPISNVDINEFICNDINHYNKIKNSKNGISIFGLKPIINNVPIPVQLSYVIKSIIALRQGGSWAGNY